MNPSIHAFIDVPKDLALDERAMFIGRLVSLYHGTHEPSPIHVGCDCYKLTPWGEAEPEIEHKLLEGLHYDGKLSILFSDEEHLACPLAPQFRRGLTGCRLHHRASARKNASQGACSPFVENSENNSRGFQDFPVYSLTREVTLRGKVVFIHE